MKYLKIYLPTTILMFLTVAVFMSFKPMTAKAVSGACAGSYDFGLAQFYGYSNCKLFNTGVAPNYNVAGLVLPNELIIPSAPYATETTEFENTISGDLSAGGQSTVGAAFIIDTMLGVSADSANSTVAYARANYSNWAAIVNEYSSAKLIEYNYQYPWPCGSIDSAYDPVNQDDFYLTISAAGQSVTSCGPNAHINTVAFFSSGANSRLLYRIGTECGNAVGEGLPALKTIQLSGKVQTKNTTSGVIAPVPSSWGLSVTLNDTTDSANSTTVGVSSNGTYSVSVPDSNDHFSLSIGTTESGYGGPYTDYQGATNFTDAASGGGAPYNCGPTNYDLQVLGTPSTPNNAGRSGAATCLDVGGNADYNFVYLTSSPSGTGVCNSLTTSGTSPTFTAVASYTLAAGVTYKSASFNWGDGSAAVSGTNSNGTVTTSPHTYTAIGTYNVTATLTFTNSAGKVSTSICPPASVTYNPGVGNGPTLTCNGSSSYQAIGTVSPAGEYIGADYTGASISFSTSNNFDSDANHGISLSPYLNQASQLTVEATGSDSGLGITTPITYSAPTGSSTITGNLPIQTPVGIYSVPYQVKIVDVVTDTNPATHWAPVPNPNPTPKPAPPTAPYTSETTTVAAPAFTTIAAPGSPTTGYYTKEDIKTTYTYTNTTTTAPTKGPCIDFNIQAGICLVYGPGTPGGTVTTIVATNTSDQYYYYITWVTTPNVECPSPVPVQVGYQPYMKVYGGDVVAGSTFDPGLTTACTPLSSQRSNIIGWNYDTGSYSGGGTEYAGYALGAIDGFATSQGSSKAGIGLSFASVNVSPPAQNAPASGKFGGSFIPVSCAPDFFDAKPATAAVPPSNDLGNIPSGSYYQNGSFTINGGTINTGAHVVIYVDGNVYINGNISLGDSWNTIADIPSFELIVQNGNIYIDNSVTRLDGVYVAQDLNQAGTGTIYDCSVNEAQASGTEFSDNCYQPLVINGSFIATQVDLMRTTSPADSTSSSNTLFESNGDRTTSGGPDSAAQSSQASEVFNYSPAVWLGLTNNALLGTDTNNVGLNNYNSITSLPPVL